MVIIMCQPHVTQLRSELLDHSHSPRACEFPRETKEVPELLVLVLIINY